MPWALRAQFCPTPWIHSQSYFSEWITLLTIISYFEGIRSINEVADLESCQNILYHISVYIHNQRVLESRQNLLLKITKTKLMTILITLPWISQLIPWQKIGRKYAAAYLVFFTLLFQLSAKTTVIDFWTNYQVWLSSIWYIESSRIPLYSRQVVIASLNLPRYCETKTVNETAMLLPFAN